MRRRLFTILSAGSLLLCVATCVLWVRSYWMRDDVWCFRRDHVVRGYPDDRQIWREWFMRSSQGEFTAGSDGFWQPVSTKMGWWQHEARAAFSLDGFTPRIPIWYLVLVSSISPAIWLQTQIQRRAHSKPGCCQSCGYDLRATPDRCPECGTVVAGRKA